MAFIFKKKNQSKKRATYQKYALFSVFYVFFSVITHAQDSIPEAKDLTEEKELKFQQFFFKALSQKSIGNHQKAIENLENCNQILANNSAIFFEFSKNYLQLKKPLLAKEYINRALKNNADNIWMLKHLVKIYQAERNYEEAIKTQQKVVVLNSKERYDLVRLFLQNKEYNKAILVMNDMQTENSLPLNLKRIKDNLEKKEIKTVVKEKTFTSLKNQFKTNKSYSILKQILKNSENNIDEVLRYANEGITLFPAQPYIYLMKGKALNDKKKYKKALVTLNNGIDFVIEDKMESYFYNQMAKSHKGLGNVNEQKKYEEKSKKLKS